MPAQEVVGSVLSLIRIVRQWTNQSPELDHVGQNAPWSSPAEKTRAPPCATSLRSLDNRRQLKDCSLIPKLCSKCLKCLPVSAPYGPHAYAPRHARHSPDNSVLQGGPMTQAVARKGAGAPCQDAPWSRDARSTRPSIAMWLNLPHGLYREQ